MNKVLTTRARKEVAHFASNRDVPTIMCSMIRSEGWGALKFFGELFVRRQTYRTRNGWRIKVAGGCIVETARQAMVSYKETRAQLQGVVGERTVLDASKERISMNPWSIRWIRRNDVGIGNTISSKASFRVPNFGSRNPEDTSVIFGTWQKMIFTNLHQRLATSPSS